MRIKNLHIGLAFAALLVMAPHAVLAADPPAAGSTDGKLGELLSAELYCGVKGLVEGNIGIAIGLLIVFGALWSLAKGGKLLPAIITMVFGGLITAIPSLVESFMGGVATLMTETEMSPKGTTFTPPKCTDIRKQIDATVKEVEKNRKLDGVCTGGYLDCS